MPKPELVRTEPAPVPAPKGAFWTATAQRERADDLLDANLTDAPRYPWGALDALIGPVRPTDVHVFAATTGGGKSTFLTSLLRAFVAEGRAVIYAPMEVDTEETLLQMAAFTLGYDYRRVALNEWDRLPAGAKEALRTEAHRFASGGLFYQLDG